MFVFFYSLIGVAVLFILIFGLSHLSLGKPAHILWYVPVLLGVFFTLYFVAFFGRKLGHDQMQQLHNFLESCTGLKFHEE